MGNLENLSFVIVCLAAMWDISVKPCIAVELWFFQVVFIDSFQDPPVWSRVWISEDEGLTYSVTNITFNLDKILFHPDKQDIMLGYDKDDAVVSTSCWKCLFCIQKCKMLNHQGYGVNVVRSKLVLIPGCKLSYPNRSLKVWVMK